MHTKFQSSASSTFTPSNNQWDIQYGTGEATGFLVRDRVSVGGEVVADQIFALSNSTVSTFERAPFDGLMGMGFSTIASYRRKHIHAAECA